MQSFDQCLRSALTIAASRSTFHHPPFHEVLVNFGGITPVKQRYGAAARGQMSWQLTHEEQKYDADEHDRQPGLILTHKSMR